MQPCGNTCGMTFDQSHDPGSVLRIHLDAANQTSNDGQRGNQLGDGKIFSDAYARPGSKLQTHILHMNRDKSEEAVEKARENIHHAPNINAPLLLYIFSHTCCSSLSRSQPLHAQPSRISHYDEKMLKMKNECETFLLILVQMKKRCVGKSTPWISRRQATFDPFPQRSDLP